MLELPVIQQAQQLTLIQFLIKVVGRACLGGKSARAIHGSNKSEHKR